MSDVTFDFKSGETIVHRKQSEDWKITLVENIEYTYRRKTR